MSALLSLLLEVKPAGAATAGKPDDAATGVPSAPLPAAWVWRAHTDLMASEQPEGLPFVFSSSSSHPLPPLLSPSLPILTTVQGVITATFLSLFFLLNHFHLLKQSFFWLLV